MIGFGFGIVVIASLGLVARTRWIAACCLVLLAAGSLVTLVVGSSSKITEGLLFLVPCALVLMFAVWLVVVEQRSRRTSAGAD